MLLDPWVLQVWAKACIPSRVFKCRFSTLNWNFDFESSTWLTIRLASNKLAFESSIDDNSYNELPFTHVKRIPLKNKSDYSFFQPNSFSKHTQKSTCSIPSNPLYSPKKHSKNTKTKHPEYGEPLGKVEKTRQIRLGMIWKKK